MMKWISPTEYEQIVANWLPSQGFYNIKLTKASCDYGADILCERMGYKYAVQCKLYSKPVGYKAVEEVLSALHYYKCHGAIIVTNNTYTRQAVDGAQKTGVILIERLI